MLRTVVRTIAGIVAGLIVALMLVIGVEGFSSVVHPLPKDFNHTMEEMCLHVERYPPWVLAVCGLMWVASALAATWVATKVGNVYAAGVVGLLLLAALVMNLSMLPYPMWFKAGCLLGIPAAILLAIRLARPRGPGLQGELVST